jgi:hypothetical protein
MEKEEIQQMIDFLNKNLNESEKLFSLREESHAYILGYLQVIIKLAISDLKSNLN